MKANKSAWLIVLVMCLLSPVAWAWSGKEHIQFTRLAAEALLADATTPPAMKEWIKQAMPGLLDEEGEKQFFLHAKVGADPQGFSGISRYAILPDIHAFEKNPQKLEAFNALEKLMHFVDLELFVTGDQKREYRDDLSALPKLENIPNDVKDPRFQQAGFLPLRVPYCYDMLVKAIKEKRLLQAEKKVEAEDDSAARWAGYLAHYLEDNTQPLHATMDYKCASYFANSRKAPNVHAEMEFKMADDEKDEHPTLRAEFWPLFVKARAEVKDPAADTADLFAATCKVSIYSYQAIPMIGRSAKKNVIPSTTNKPDEVNTEKFFRASGTFQGKTMTVMQMKALQTALAVKRVQHIWRQAWKEATGD